MFRSHVRQGLALVLAVALALFVNAFVPAAANAADADPISSLTPAAVLAPTVSADALPTTQIDGVVWKQVIVGNTVYVGGQFTTARPAGSAAGTNTVPRANMLAYDIRTGALITSFAPTFNGKVADLAVTPDGSKLIAVGTFTQVDGQTRNRAAVFDLSPSGATLSNTVVPNLNGETDAVAASNSTIYFGGWFGAINGTARIRVGAVRTSNGSLVTGFSVPVDDQSVQSIVVAPDGNSIVFAGNFTSVGGSSSPGYGMARVDAATGAMMPLPVNTIFRDGGPNAGISRLATDGTSFYGVGWVYGSGGNSEGTFQANWSDGNLVTLEDCHGDTYDVAPIGDVVYVASHKHYCGNSGGFPQTDPWTTWHSTAWTKSVQGVNTADHYGYPDHPGTPRPGLLSWFPQTTPGTYTGKGQATWTVTGNSQYVLYGGEFTSVNGVRQQGLVRYAARSIAPNKEGPRPVTTGYTQSGGPAQISSYAPTVKSFSAGTARVTWPALWDRDDSTLTYQVYRDTSTNKVFQTTQTNFQWDGQPMRFDDTGLTPGSTVRYAIRTLDPSGNLINSSWVTVTIASGDTLGTYGNAVLNDGATKFWRLDEPSGTGVSDWAGTDDTTAGSGVARNSAGALTNSTDTASTFDGTTNGVAISKALIPGPNTFSQEVWFKTTSTSGGKIAGFGDSATGTSGNYDRHIYMNTQGRVLFGVYNGTTSTIQSGTGLNNGQWHQAVATMGPAGMALYIDGKRVASRSDVTVGQAYSGYWRVGGDSSWSGNPYFAGSIDEYSVFPTVLTPAQVDNHWVASGRTSTLPAAPADNLGKAMFDSGPDSYWRLGELSGSTAADAAFGTNTGTYSGTVTKNQAGVTSANRAVRLGANGNVTGTVAVNNPTTFSQEIWIKTLTTTGGRIFGFGDSSTGTTSSNYDRHLYMLDNGKVRFGVYNGNTVTIDSNNALNDGNWHQLVSTFGPQGMKLYVDGVLNSSDPNTSAQNYTGYWKIGGDNTWGGNSSMYFAGTVDEAAVYPQPLSLSQVQNHFTAGGGTVNNVKPTAAFTASNVDLAASFDGSGSSDPEDTTVTSYAWDFGDNTAAGSGAKPDHTYDAAGTYTVKLTVTDSNGATDSVSHDVAVTAPNQKPTAAFTSSKVDLAASFDGSGSSDPEDTTVTSYAWDFGDNTAAGSGAKPDHTYDAAGTYTVKLTVTDSKGATDSVSHDVAVTAPNQKPTAAFTSSKVDLKASFDGSGSSDPEDTTVTSYAWDFGDNTAAGSGAKPDHTYDAAGTYTVKLTVTDSKGATDSVSHDVAVSAPVPNAKPTAAFTASNVDLKASFDGSGSSDPEDTTVTSYAWDFGDNTAAGSGAKPVHTYTAAGTYTVKLTVTDSKGATDSVSHDVAVTAPASNVLASDSFARTATSGWGTADFGGAWTIRGTASRASVGSGAGQFLMPNALTEYADLTGVSSTTSRVTTEFSVDKPYVGTTEGYYIGAVGRQVGTNSYAARLVVAADGSVKMYLLRNASVALAAAYTVPGLTIVPGQHYKLSVMVSGTTPTTVSAKVWKASDTEPTAWQKTGTDTFAALQAAGGVGLFVYQPGGSTNTPITFSFYSFAATKD